MAFIVSARKYRPSGFETLIGQDNIAKTLKNSILTEQMAHAYLFCGPRGVGKTSTARIFAKTINCSNPTADLEPCGECESCKSFEQGRSYCIHELDAASNNSVEDIRSLIDQVRVPPQIGKFSVFIIDEVHMLSSAAFNAFLKTLEEPPAHAIFILATTEKHKILPTILSRCQTYDFNRISVEDMVKNLKNIASKESVTISEDALHIIAQKADGAMRDALTLFDQTVAFCGNDVTYEMVIKNLNVLDYDYYFKLTDYFLNGSFAEALLLFDEILTKGFNSLHFISGLSQHFRDLIVCKNKASHSLATLAPTIIAKYDDYAAKCDLRFLYEALAVTTSCEAGYKNTGNPRLHIEFALMKLSQLRVAFAQEAVASSAIVPIQAPVQAPAQSVAQPATVPLVQSTASVAQPAVAPTPATPAPITPEAPNPATAPSPIEEASQPINVAPKVVAEPTPQVAPQPAVEVKPKVSTGASIKSLMQGIKEEEVSQENTDIIELQDDEQTDVAEITPERIRAAWDDVLATLKQPKLLAELSRTVPIYNKDTNTAVQYVSNINQKTWIMNNCIFSLEGAFRRSLKNKEIKLLVDVRPESEDEIVVKKPYMPGDIARTMREKSADLQQLEKTLELEIV